MKLIHLSDLHLGKRISEFNMLEDQRYILGEIERIADEEKADAVIIAGDVYDKSVPSAEAVQLFDEFIWHLFSKGLPVLVISGNHDSPERIAFGSRIMDAGGVYMSPVYNGNVEPIVLSDSFGEVNFYLLPFIKPAHVKRYFEEETAESYTDAVKTAIAHMNVDFSKRNVLICHQFVTGALRSESEDISVGGLDNVDGSVFEGFDYTALGHIHSAQNVGNERIRYCGTPLKYSFSEQRKSVTIAELSEKGKISVKTAELKPLREMRELRGTYMELTAKKSYEGTNREDFLHITLTDEEDIPEAVSKLRVIYPNLMKLDYDNARTSKNRVITNAEDTERKTPQQLFAELYEQQNNQPMSLQQRQMIDKLVEEIWEGGI